MEPRGPEKAPIESAPAPDSHDPAGATDDAEATGRGRGLRPGTLGDVAALGFFVYLFMALRRMYGDGRLVTAVKFLVLLTIHSIVLSFALLGAVVLAALRLQGGG